MTASGARPRRSHGLVHVFQVKAHEAEIRRPKPEGRRKAEIRRPNEADSRNACGLTAGSRNQSASRSFGLRRFGFRPSFGLRPSDFGFHPRLRCPFRRRPKAPHIRHARAEHLVLRKRRAGVEAVAHFGAEQLLELPRGLDDHRGSLLAEQVKPVRRQARRGVALDIEIMVPLLLAILGVEAASTCRRWSA